MVQLRLTKPAVELHSIPSLQSFVDPSSPLPEMPPALSQKIKFQY